VALTGGGIAKTNTCELDKTHTTNNMIDNLPLLIMQPLYQNQGRKVKEIKAVNEVMGRAGIDKENVT